MKLFDLSQVPAKEAPYQVLQKQAIQIIIQICKGLQISLPAMHAALWVFHCNAILMGFHRFDRYMYACGAVLVGTKLMECLRYPTQILGVCRKALRKRKNLDSDVDSDQYLKKQVKKVFQAEVNIMINIGFSFDIKLGIEEAERLKLFQHSPVSGFSTKLKQTLTSLYSTQIVVLFDPQVITILAVRILLKAENRNIQTLDFDLQLKNKLNQDKVRQAQKQYLLRCGFD